MRKRAVCRFGICLLMILLIFSNCLLCYGEEAEGSAEPTPGVPVIKSIRVSPETAVVSKNSTCAFSAAVTGENDYSSEVAWSVSGQKSQSTFIDSRGVLNVGADETASSLVVKAVSKQDSSFSATALASLRRTEYSIQVKASPDNGGTVSGGGNVEEGRYTVLSASANNGYAFDGWSLDGVIVSRDSQYVVDNIYSDRTYVAVFSTNGYTLTLLATPADAGAVSGQGTYDKGSNVKVIATPASGYRFAGWTENGSLVSTNQEYSVENISRDMYLVANFETKTYTINAGVSSLNGTIAPEGKSTVSESGEITYTITPKGGYTVKAVYVDGKSVGAVSSYSFTDVKENHNISVDFVAVSGQENRVSTPSPGKDKADKKEETDESKADEAEPNKDDEDGQEEESRLTGTLRYLDISEEEAERLIDENNDRELMLGALATGDLTVKVKNDFAGSGQKIFFDGFDEDSGVANLDKVLGGILTSGEKMEMLKGDAPIAVNLQINDALEEPVLIVKTFEENKLPERKIGKYFEMSLTKSVQNDTQVISELPKKLRVVINVPENLKAARRDFYILRLHTGEDGKMEYTELADEDDSPDTISFATDRFSSYAIAYTDRQTERTEISGSAKQLSGSRGLLNILVVAAIILATGITFFLVFYIVREGITRRRGK